MLIAIREDISGRLMLKMEDSSEKLHLYEYLDIFLNRLTFDEFLVLLP